MQRGRRLLSVRSTFLALQYTPNSYTYLALTIKITPHELSLLNNESSIPFTDGSGSIAETAVYHELHCVKRVRRYLHLEYYYPNLSPQEREIEDRHIGKTCKFPQLVLSFG